VAIEPLLTGSVVLVSAAAPPMLARYSKFGGGTIFFASIAFAMVASEIVFRIANPDFHHGPVYSVAIIMHLCISAIIVSLSMALALRLHGNRIERDLP
jgi:hypothetical protein